MNENEKEIPCVPESTTLPFQDECEHEIIRFVGKHKLTPEELFAAHELALGVPEQDLEMKLKPQEKVFELAKRLGELYKEGFSVTRVAELCDYGREIDKTPTQVIEEIANLSITDAEKKLLTGLVKNLRPGTLYLFQGDETEPIGSLTIDQRFCDHPMRDRLFAQKLLSVFDKIKDKKIAFSFES